MENKQIFIIVGIVLGAFVVSLLSVVGIYFYDPSILGFPASKEKGKEKEETILASDEIPFAETVNITRERLAFFERTFIQKKALENKNDSLLKIENTLLDSIDNLQARTSNAVKNAEQSEKVLNDTLDVISELKDSINTLNDQYKKSQNKLKELQNTIKNQELYIADESDSLRTKNFKKFADIYNSTDPAEVAKILEQIDERDAANIIKMMSKRKAGKVLEAMAPENAAAILLLGGSK